MLDMSLYEAPDLVMSEEEERDFRGQMTVFCTISKDSPEVTNSMYTAPLDMCLRHLKHTVVSTLIESNKLKPFNLDLLEGCEFQPGLTTGTLLNILARVISVADTSTDWNCWLSKDATPLERITEIKTCYHKRYMVIYRHKNPSFKNRYDRDLKPMPGSYDARDSE